MARVRGFVAEHLADPDAVLVIDESGQEESGADTVGVKRQYVGCAGKITNAVNIVYATYASRRGHATVTARLYLPAEWADDPHRRKAAKVPEQVSFATKPELAVQILTELAAEASLPGWLTGDEVYYWRHRAGGLTRAEFWLYAKPLRRSLCYSSISAELIIKKVLVTWWWCALGSDVTAREQCSDSDPCDAARDRLLRSRIGDLGRGRCPAWEAHPPGGCTTIESRLPGL